MKSNYPTVSGRFFDGMNDYNSHLKCINKLTWSFSTNFSRPSANGAIFIFVFELSRCLKSV